jgi:hypothetical protein
MIISHKHRFIFIHCRKTAGSSVVSSFSRYLGSHDLQFSGITDGRKLNLYPPRRVIIESLKFMSAKDYFLLLSGKKSFWHLVSNSIKKKYAPLLGSSPAHAPASATAKAFPDEWTNYFKFCIVRNPWDKTLSDYYWKIKHMKNPPTFDAFIEALSSDDNSLNGIIPANHSNWLMYTIDDQVAVDYIVRYEELERGLIEALAHTSLKWDGWIPHMKKGVLKQSTSIARDYRNFYTDDTAQIVYDLYENEINQFDYKF